jgi:hypothetical protein
MGCGCRQKTGTKVPKVSKKSAPQIRVARAVPRTPVTKRLPQGTRVRR